MVLTTSMLIEQLNGYSDPAGKILRMKRNGEIYRLNRGIYENNGNTQGYCLAGVIFGPSYLSFALNKRNLRLASDGFVLTRNRGFLPGFCLCSHFSYSP